MFNVQDRTITISRGDTGAVRFYIDGYAFANNDVAIFTLSTAAGVNIMTVVSDNGALADDGMFTVYFRHDDTKDLSEGNYVYDIRIVINPRRNASNDVVNGDQVLTPEDPGTFVVKAVVGKIGR
jgi:hypothetical protein